MSSSVSFVCLTCNLSNQMRQLSSSYWISKIHGNNNNYIGSMGVCYFFLLQLQSLRWIVLGNFSKIYFIMDYDAVSRIHISINWEVFRLRAWSDSSVVLHSPLSARIPFVVQFLTQLLPLHMHRPAYNLGKQQTMVQGLGTLHPRGKPLTPGSWLKVGSVPAMVAKWWVNHLVGDSSAFPVNINKSWKQIVHIETKYASWMPKDVNSWRGCELSPFVWVDLPKGLQ